MNEADAKAHIRLAIGREARHCRLWNNPCGTAFTGEILRSGPHLLTLANPRRVKYGVANPGGSDLIGLSSVEVTAELVGKRIAVFTAAEVKQLGQKPPEHQQLFLEFVRAMGGFADVVRSPEEALTLVTPRGLLNG